MTRRLRLPGARRLLQGVFAPIRCRFVRRRWVDLQIDRGKMSSTHTPRELVTNSETERNKRNGRYFSSLTCGGFSGSGAAIFCRITAAASPESGRDSSRVLSEMTCWIACDLFHEGRLMPVRKRHRRTRVRKFFFFFFASYNISFSLLSFFPMRPVRQWR